MKKVEFFPPLLILKAIFLQRKSERDTGLSGYRATEKVNKLLTRWS